MIVMLACERSYRKGSRVTRGGPLEDIRVIDLAGEPGAFAGRTLAQLGADVVRIEPPEGDPLRRRSPFLVEPVTAADDATERVSLYHEHMNAGKRSLVLDLASFEGRERLLRLATTADLALLAGPQADEVSIEALRAANPALLVTTISPFGEGPLADYRGSDLTAVASSGLMYLNGMPEDPPQAPGGEQGYHMGSIAAVATSLVALLGRDRDPRGAGHQIDVSLQEATSMSTLQTANANIYTWHAQIPRRIGLITQLGGRSLYETADGRWVSFTIPINAPHLWAGFADWARELGIGDRFSDERWADPVFRSQRPAELAGVITQLCSMLDRATLFAEGQRRRLLVMPVNDAADLLADEHLNARDFFEEVPRPGGGAPLRDAGSPFRFSTGRSQLAPAPAHGEHSSAIEAELDGIEAPSNDIDASTLAGAGDGTPALPLEGIRVADFFWLIAGPATSRILADWGADVIKIESESRIDTIRVVGVQPKDPGTINTCGVFADCNTNKRSLNINLNTPRGIELAKELIAECDVVTNNFTGDRMDRWGLGYEELRKVRPDLVMLTMPVMGTSGPYRRYGSYGNGVIAYAGMNASMGLPGRPPVGIAPLYSDFSAPYQAASAILAALHHRERTGEGQFIELAQVEGTINLLGSALLEASATGAAPELRGNRSLDAAPHNAFRCAGEDRWVAIAVSNDEQWRALCGVIDRPRLATDARFATLEARRSHEDELEAIVEDWTGDLDAWEAMHRLQQGGVPAAVVEDLEDLTTRDPALPGRHLVPVRREGEPHTYTLHAQPARIDGATAPLTPPPHFGEHNEEILRGLLGYDEASHSELLAAGVLS
jgi:crotonobetainyl-CoA:carnitine CoA-transferase CaiB-like acyl-CoA transferase